MTGINEISRSIGKQEEAIKGLGRSFDRHCEDDDRRHNENVDVLRAIEKQLGGIADTLAPVVESVKFMRPIVDGYQASRLKALGALSLASTLLIGVGWLVTSLAGRVIEWIVSHLKF